MKGDKSHTPQSFTSQFDSSNYKNLSEKEEREVSNKRIRTISILDYIILVILCFIISVAVNYFFYNRYVVKVAVVDLDSYVMGLRSLYVTNKISDSEMKQYIDRAVEVIKSESKDTLILLGGSVLSRPSTVKVIKLPELPKEAQQLRLEDLIKGAIPSK